MPEILGRTSPDSDFENADLYDELKKNGELTVRIYYAYGLDPKGLTPRILKRLEQARLQHHDEWISTGAVKFYMDGVIESHTAAMLTPYSDDPTQQGKLFWDPLKYKQAVQKLDKLGFQTFHPCNRRKSGAHGFGRLRKRTTSQPYSDSSTHRTYRDRQRPRYSTLREIGSDCQLPAAACLSG